MFELLPPDFRFIRPDWFWALLPALLLLGVLLNQRRRGAAWHKVCDAHLLPHLLSGVERKKRIWPLLIVLLAWLMAVIALAGPVWQQLPQPVFESEEARVMVLDLSHSMDATDVAPSRLTRAKFKLLDMLKYSDVGQTGLVVFAADAFVVSPLTQDANTIAAMVSALETAVMPAQGSRADLALRQADDLFKQGNVLEGDIILITDGVNERALTVAAQISAAGRRVSVLAVGTAQGAPVPVDHGGFLKDRNGGIVIPRLDIASLSELAATGGGRFSLLRTDERDVALLMAPQQTDALAEAKKNEDINTDTWREEGPWLLLALLPLALLAFRRGALLCVALVAVLAAPQEAMALDWDNLWSRPDQQASQLLAEGQAAEAAQRFEDPAWQAHAYYRAGEYAEAASAYSKLDNAEAHYNRGNALAKLGQMQEALAAYDQALALDESLADARFNRDLVEKLLAQRQEEPERGEGGDSSEQEEQASSEQQNESQEGQQGDESESQQNQSSDAADGEAESQQSAEGQTDDEAAAEDDAAEAMDDAQSEEGEQQQSEQMMPAEADEQASEHQQAMEQWLRTIPDDPGGLLRRKFLYQHQREQAQGKREQMEQAW